MSTLRHLPAIIDRPGRTEWVLTTACGARGPISARESAGETVDLFLGGPEEWERSVCQACLVKWDAAEMAGAMRVVWVLNGKTGWAGPGAAVFASLPSCSTCSVKDRQEWQRVNNPRTPLSYVTESWIHEQARRVWQRALPIGVVVR